MKGDEDIFLSKFGITAAELELRQGMRRFITGLAISFQHSVLASAAQQPNLQGVAFNVQQALEISKRVLNTVVFAQNPLDVIPR